MIVVGTIIVFRNLKQRWKPKLNSLCCAHCADAPREQVKVKRIPIFVIIA